MRSKRTLEEHATCGGLQQKHSHQASTSAQGAPTRTAAPKECLQGLQRHTHTYTSTRTQAHTQTLSHTYTQTHTQTHAQMEKETRSFFFQFPLGKGPHAHKHTHTHMHTHTYHTHAYKHVDFLPVTVSLAFSLSSTLSFSHICTQFRVVVI